MMILAMFFLKGYFSITFCFPVLLVHYLLHQINQECLCYFYCRKLYISIFSRLILAFMILKNGARYDEFFSTTQIKEEFIR